MTTFSIGDRVRISRTAKSWDGPLFRGYSGIIVGFGDAAGVPDFPGDAWISPAMARVCLWEPREIVLVEPRDLELLDAFRPQRRVVAESAAADILNVRGVYLRNLLDDGVLPWHYANHQEPGEFEIGRRYLYYDDLLRYMRARDKVRQEALRVMTRQGYDQDE